MSAPANRLKSWFILWYPLTVLVIGLLSIAMIVQRGLASAWVGTLLSVLPFVGLYLRATFSKHMARTSHRLPVLTLITALGGLWAAYRYIQGGMVETWATPLAAVAVVGFFLFDFWYSSFGRQLSEQLRVGELLPEFTAEDADGNPVSSLSLRGKPALFMFYRGNWCPFCMAQVREIVERYRELIDRGVEVALISPQPHDLTRRVAEIFDVPFNFWVDKGLKAARALEIVDDLQRPSGDSSRPTARTRSCPR